MLDGLDLHLPDGALGVLLGPSGAGKSTLLRAVAGLVAPAAGAVRVGGRQLDGLRPERRRVGLVFQEPRLFPHLCALDDVAFPLRVRGVGRRARRAAALALLAEVGLAERAAQRVGTLSGGEQQRVALARALAADPDVLLLDEPLAAVDPARRDGLRDLLRRVQAERRLTMLLVTHDRDDAAGLGDLAGVLLDGQVRGWASPEQLFERPDRADVARFVGLQLVRGNVRDGLLRLGDARLPVDAPDGRATLAIRPEHVRLDPASPLRLAVVASTAGVGRRRLALAGSGISLMADVDGWHGPRIGDVVGVALPPSRLWRLPTAAPARERVALEALA